MSSGYVTHRDGYSLEAEYWRDRRRHRQSRTPRRRGQASRQPYRPTSFDRLDFEQLVHPENLLASWRHLRRYGGQAAGVDGLTYTDFSKAEAAQILRVVSESIRRGRYRPQPTRQVLIPKSNGREMRQLDLPTVVDRAVAKAVEIALSQPVDDLLGDHVFGFRLRRSVVHMLAAIERRMQQTDRWTIVQDDIRSAFPSADLPRVVASFSSLISDNRIIDLIERVLTGPTGQHRTGLSQGNPLAPTAMNVLLHSVLDRPRAGQYSPPFRYADNFVVAGTGVTEGVETMRREEQLLQCADMAFKGDDEPTDLAKPGPSTLLGLQLQKRGRRLRLATPPAAWEDLHRTLRDAHGTDDPHRGALDAATGWMAYHGSTLEDAGARTDAVDRVIRAGTMVGHSSLREHRGQLIRTAEDGLRRWREAREAEDRLHPIGSRREES